MKTNKTFSFQFFVRFHLNRIATDLLQNPGSAPATDLLSFQLNRVGDLHYGVVGASPYTGDEADQNS
jgi:hypothetical protein